MKTWKSHPFCVTLSACALALTLLSAVAAQEEAAVEQEEAIEQAGASEKPWSVEVDTGWFSDYVWRGQRLGGHSWQSGVTLGAYGFAFNVWHQHDFKEGQTTELDYTFSYDLPLGMIHESLDIVALSVGYLYYTFPNLDEDDESHEFFTSVGLDVPLEPTFTYYYDWELGNGSYYHLGVGHEFDMSEYASLNLGAGVGYNDGQWGYKSSFSDLLLSASLGIPIGDYVSINPGVAVSIGLTNDYDDVVIGSCTLGVAF